MSLLLFVSPDILSVSAVVFMTVSHSKPFHQRDGHHVVVLCSKFLW